MCKFNSIKKKQLKPYWKVINNESDLFVPADNADFFSFNGGHGAVSSLHHDTRLVNEMDTRRSVLKNTTSYRYQYKADY